jgi:hypothetical protein
MAKKQTKTLPTTKSVVETRQKRKEAKFAPDFFPMISASKLGEICATNSEFTKIRFLRQLKPFSDIYINKEKKALGKADEPGAPKEKVSRSLLDHSDKEIIKQHLNESINVSALTFNDHHVIRNFKQTIETNIKKKKASKGLGRKRPRWTRMGRRMELVHRLRNFEL